MSVIFVGIVALVSALIYGGESLAKHDTRTPPQSAYAAPAEPSQR